MFNLSPLWKSTTHTLSSQRIADREPIEEWSMALGAWERIHADAHNRENQQPEAGHNRKNIETNQRSQWITDQRNARKIRQQNNEEPATAAFVFVPRWLSFLASDHGA